MIKSSQSLCYLDRLLPPPLFWLLFCSDYSTAADPTVPFCCFNWPLYHCCRYCCYYIKLCYWVTICFLIRSLMGTENWPDDCAARASIKRLHDRALIDYQRMQSLQMQSLNWLHGYTEVLMNCLRVQSLDHTCNRRHLESSQSLIKSWSIGRCSTFKSDQPELPSGRPCTLIERQSTERFCSQIESVTRCQTSSIGSQRSCNGRQAGTRPI